MNLFANIKQILKQSCLNTSRDIVLVAVVAAHRPVKSKWSFTAFLTERTQRGLCSMQDEWLDCHDRSSRVILDSTQRPSRLTALWHYIKFVLLLLLLLQWRWWCRQVACQVKQTEVGLIEVLVHHCCHFSFCSCLDWKHHLVCFLCKYISLYSYWLSIGPCEGLSLCWPSSRSRTTGHFSQLWHGNDDNSICRFYLRLLVTEPIWNNIRFIYSAQKCPQQSKTQLLGSTGWLAGWTVCGQINFVVIQNHILSGYVIPILHDILGDYMN